MLDAFMRKKIDGPLKLGARALARLGVRANGVTLAGLVFGFAAAAAVIFGYYHLALLAFLLNRLCDGLDGPLARLHGASDFGGFLDIVCDFLVYNALALGFLLAAPENLLPGAFLLLSFVGTGSTFLAYAIVAAKRGANHERQGKKTFYYLGGLAEGTETIVFFALCLLWPPIFPIAAWIFAGLCALTTLVRALSARRYFA